MKQLKCYSFHSVKGGVGKSTLSSFLAAGLAREHGQPVYLIDMDLTGTSLADVLPLESPILKGGTRLDLQSLPKDYYPRDISLQKMVERESLEGSSPGYVPFLNDFLLYADGQWDASHDVNVRSISWRMENGPEGLRVIPSSALPRDLEAVLPLIFDEEQVAFLEGRLEYLLEGILSEHDSAIVVFDTPPTIPGLSRAVLSLALRLAKPIKGALAEPDGYIPELLDSAKIDWRAFMVTTMDLQDARAIHRWLSLIEPEDEAYIQVVVNRVKASELDLEERLSNLLGYGGTSIVSPAGGISLPPSRSSAEVPISPLFEQAIAIERDEGLSFFLDEISPPEDQKIIEQLCR